MSAAAGRRNWSSDFATDTVLWCGFVGMWGRVMSVLDDVEAFRKSALYRKQVSISRDGEDFVVAYQPDNLIVFRHAEASALRRVCRQLRWEIVSDTIAEPDDVRSW